MNSTSEKIKQAVAEFYLQSSDFNGISLERLVLFARNEAHAREELKILVQESHISCAFYKLSGNPHIKRLPDPPLETQLTRLNVDPAEEICCYPSSDLIHSFIDVASYNDRPFTKKLLLGKAHLAYVGFDLGVLERYFNDPRYYVSLSDYSGYISVGDEAYSDGGFPERDKIVLASFGLGYDEKRRRLALAFLRDLSDLSPEHQWHWNSFMYHGKFKILEDFYRNSFLGEWTDNVSYFQAIISEIQLINAITMDVYRRAMFRGDFSRNRPPGMSFFLRPTLKNFNEFVSAMDKALSENFDRRFFADQIPLEREEKRKDGKIIVRDTGTLMLLEEWLRVKLRWHNEDEAIKAMVSPLREVRKLRQSPAHKIEENVHDESLEEKQHQILKDVYLALMHLRKTLLRHPSAPGVEIPDFLREGKIVFF